jgi:hypothetical protein
MIHEKGGWKDESTDVVLISPCTTAKRLDQNLSAAMKRKRCNAISLPFFSSP